MKLGTEAQKEFFQCNLFEEGQWEDFKFSKGFEVKQQEIKINQQQANEVSAETGQHHTRVADYLGIKYMCSFQLSNLFEKDKPQIILCVRDNCELLEYTLNNLTEYKIFEHANVTIVDDRSERNIKLVSDKFECSYLRVDNDKGFNFSMLNNIAAYIYRQLECDTIVLWNSDLWAVDDTTFPELLSLHKENDAQISGAKLLYPTFRWDGNEEEETLSVVEIFKGMENHYRGTVQFGGAGWIFEPTERSAANTNALQYYNILPIHAFRFRDKNIPAVNSDKGDSFVTGAFQIINLDWFINIGGFNPSMARLFQDVDLCLRSDRVFYFGKDKYFVHDESLSQPLKEKKDDLYVNDHILFKSFWSEGRGRERIGF